MIRTLLRGCATLVAAATLSGHALAGYPDKPIRLLVGFAAGGITDITARQVAEGMGKALGQPIIVENRAGAGGNIASAELARAPSDGYTIMLASPGQLVVNPLTMKSLGFDPNTKFTLIGLTNESPFVMVVPANSRFKSVPELIEWGKKHDNGLTYASPGLGTTMHIGAEMLQVAAGAKAVHVPYKGGSQATNDLVAGRIDFMLDSIGAVTKQVEGGLLRILAVASSHPLPRYPDAPLLSSYYPGVEVSSWLGVVAPPQLPVEIQARLEKALAATVQNPQYVQMLNARGSVSAPLGHEAFAAHLAKERERVERTVVKTGLRLD